MAENLPQKKEESSKPIPEQIRETPIKDATSRALKLMEGEVCDTLNSEMCKSDLFKMITLDPRVFFDKMEKFRSSPHFEEAIFFCAEESPYTVAREFDKIQNEPFAEKIAEIIIETGLHSFLEYVEPIIRKQAYHDRLSNKALEKITIESNGYLFFTFFDVFKKIKFSKDFLKRMIDKSPGMFFDKFDLISNPPSLYNSGFIFDLAVYAISQSPRYLFAYSGKISKWGLYEKAAKKGLLIALESDPYGLLDTLQYESNSEALKLSDTILEKTIDLYPDLILKADKFFKQNPRHENILKKALYKCLEFSTSVAIIFKKFSLFENKDFEEDILTKAAIKSPLEFIENFDN
jgi:hypothetical protein